MSAILKALKKLEATTGQPGSPPLPGPVDPRTVFRREPRRSAGLGRAAVAVGIGLILAGGIWIYFQQEQNSPTDAPVAQTPVASRSDRTPVKPAPIKPVRTPETPPSQPEPIHRRPAPSSSRPQPPEVVRPPVRPDATPTAPRPERPIRRAVAGAVQPEAPDPPRAFPPPRPAPAVGGVESRSQAPAKTVAARPSPEPVAEAPPPAEPEEFLEPRPDPQPETNPSPSAPRRVDDRIHIQALVWAETPADRMAMINGTILRIGGSVDEVTVVDIGDDYLILKDNNTRWRQPFQLK